MLVILYYRFTSYENQHKSLATTQPISGIEGLRVKKQNWCRGLEMMHGQIDIQNQTEEEKNP